jgi:hypothetical protein
LLSFPCYMLTFLFFLLFLVFYHPWCCTNVCLLLTKLRSFPNQNITLIWILIKDVWIGKHLLGQHLSMGCPFNILA